MQTPKTSGEWLKISEKFKKRWNFPNGIGGVDGKHIVLQQPRNSGSHYRNYKGTYSIISLAMVGSEYGFLFADVGVNGRNSDGGNWSQSTLRKGLEEKNIKFTHRHTNTCTGDDAFPLSVYMMKPYPQKKPNIGKTNL